MTKHLDNTEFLSVVHDLIGNTSECIELLKSRSESMDEADKQLIVASISLLQLHTKLLTELAERNAVMLEHANTLIEEFKKLEKKQL